MTAGARRMVAGMLHTIRDQHSAKRGPAHDGEGEAVTTRDTPLAELLELPHNMTAGARRMVAGMLHTIRRQQSAKRGPTHDCGGEVVTTRDAPLAERRARPRHITASARRMVAGMLHTVRRQHSAKRGPPHDIEVGAVTTWDTPLAQRGPTV